VAKKNYQSSKFVGAWNFSPLDKKPKKVRAIIDYCIKNNLLKKKQIKINKNHYKETSTLMLDSTKAKKYLKWKPKLNFKETLQFTFDWYDAHKKKKNMDRFSLSQIKKYLEKK
jgi:CDP-glucose 4,6-dehydratase